MKARVFRPLSAEVARALFVYDPDTGVVSAKSDFPPWNEGHRVGCARKDGRRVISVGRVSYLEHHIIWLIVTGFWPKDQIDHRDMDKSNNRWDNLRECANGPNQANRRARSDNQTGIKGVKFDKRKGTFSARITKDWKCTHLGTFKTALEAGEAYRIAAEQMHGEFARCA